MGEFTLLHTKKKRYELSGALMSAFLQSGHADRPFLRITSGYSLSEGHEFFLVKPMGIHETEPLAA